MDWDKIARVTLPSRSCALLAAALLPGRAGAAIGGEWDTPLGRVRLVETGGAVRGTLVAPAPPCGFRAGDEVLRGTLVDDSLAGELRVCLTGPGCAPDAWGSALLLVAPDKLAGAVHVKGCQAPVGKNGGLAFTRAARRAAKPHARRPTPASPTPRRDQARALLRDGASWLQEGNFERARERFLEAVKADPGVPEAYNGVGVSHRMRNDLAAALSWYKRALAVDPDFGDAYYNMACAYAVQGKRALALRYLEIAALNGYVGAEGLDADPDLASLRTTREYRTLRDRM